MDIPARTLLSVTEQLTADQIAEFAGPLFALFAGPLFALFGGPAVPRPEGIAGLPFLR